MITGSGAATVSSDPTHVVRRGAAGQFSFEGIALMPNGVMYISDENRPTNGAPGGAILKFIPSAPWTGSGPITDLAQSPLAAGSLWGLRVGRRAAGAVTFSDYGQGNEFGTGVWVQMPASSDAAPLNSRSAAAAAKLTSYYRPEDMGIDLKELGKGNVRFCGTNTGDDTENGDNHFGEIYCITDGAVADAATVSLSTLTVGADVYTLNVATKPEYQPLVIGNFQFGMMDNVAYQPGRGNWLINEDGEGPFFATPRNNDIYDCLDDGDDDNPLADACVRVMSLNDLAAESTGGLFDGTGKNYYVSVQHNITGHGVILRVSGWLND
jgi:secreted PhoX family phosphatase